MDFYFDSVENLCRKCRKLCRSKLGQNPVTDWHMSMSTDANFEPIKFTRTESVNGISDAILSTVTPLGSQSNFAKFHINIIRNNENIICDIEFIKVYNFCDGLSGEIHKSRRFDENYFFAGDISLADKSVKFRSLPHIKIMSLMKWVH